MKALCWHGKGDVRVDDVPDPRIVDPTDAIIKVSSAAICGPSVTSAGPPELSCAEGAGFSGLPPASRGS